MGFEGITPVLRYFTWVKKERCMIFVHDQSTVCLNAMECCQSGEFDGEALIKK